MGTQRSLDRRPVQTQPWMLDPSAVAAVDSPALSTVTVMPVRLIGTPATGEALPTPTRTQRREHHRPALELPEPCTSGMLGTWPLDRFGQSALEAHELRDLPPAPPPAQRRIARGFNRGRQPIDGAALGYDDAAKSALAYAPTMPALEPVNTADAWWLAQTAERLQLRTELADRERLAPRASQPPALALPELRPNRTLERAWALWLQAPPHVAVGAAAAVCALSALAAGLLIP